MTTDDDFRRARLAELQRRRAGGSDTRASSFEVVVEPVARHGRESRGSSPAAAIGSVSKIAVTGLGFTTMLGLVAVMGYSNRNSGSNVPSIPAATPTQVVVVVHHPEGAPVSATASTAPVVLAAQPVVRPAPISQAPTGRTNGSR